MEQKAVSFLSANLVKSFSGIIEEEFPCLQVPPTLKSYDLVDLILYSFSAGPHVLCSWDNLVISKKCFRTLNKCHNIFMSLVLTRNTNTIFIIETSLPF